MLLFCAKRGGVRQKKSKPFQLFSYSQPRFKEGSFRELTHAHTNYLEFEETSLHLREYTPIPISSYRTPHRSAPEAHNLKGITERKGPASNALSRRSLVHIVSRSVNRGRARDLSAPVPETIDDRDFQLEEHVFKPSRAAARVRLPYARVLLSSEAYTVRARIYSVSS